MCKGQLSTQSRDWVFKKTSTVESSIDSSAVVSDEKIKALYGEFPHWKIPQ